MVIEEEKLLTQQKHERHTYKEEPDKRRERANRILDAATELVQRWGYRKTTIDDIAKQAGVAKGTIYLHWKTREQLFEALLYRESLRSSDELMQRLAGDPEGGTLHGIAKQTFLVTMRRPLIRGLFLQDRELLGDMLETQIGQATTQRKTETFHVYSQILRSKGLIRCELSDEQVAYALMAIIMGYMIAEPLEPQLPREYNFSLEAVADLLADTVRRTFTPATPPAPTAAQEASEAFQQMYQQMIDVVWKQMQEEMGL